jgi:Ca2+-binding RTX toxin-like protein
MGATLVTGFLAAIAIGGIARLSVDHAPPVLKAQDVGFEYANHVTVGATAHRVIFTQELDPIITDDEACMDNDGSSLTMRCRAGGITRLIVVLGDGDDELTVDLAGIQHDMSQTGRGGAGEDLLVGGADGQRLGGGDGDDRLRGGPGDDLLLGGEGTDRCRGGTGHDVLRHCEK